MDAIAIVVHVGIIVIVGIVVSVVIVALVVLGVSLLFLLRYRVVISLLIYLSHC